ncbi:uncharacterized protein TRAVEDRAFT_38648 [Trametes versicolor FP-101664 SS1]|uniref:uncharacterized protein n=1 Tax=Trametes versicolor (strain FP-101664) TaxID=717944 RepID=UPI000462240D|nr:uncharacterized protein TRAVEDRAFT_38648 [Trametes versicolor FP-101664 SS1]EIW56938.1 hypothetical protein TRAVEDRAFT_38648 [Trametes versicolor FP-101664 SS1]
MEGAGPSDAPATHTPGSTPRFPEPVYRVETPYLPYLPVKPPAYEDASDSALHTSLAGRPSMHGLYSGIPGGYRPLRDTL